MKKLFRNPDGTIKSLQASIAAFVITGLVLGALCVPMFLNDTVESSASTIQTTNVVNDNGVKTCENCNISFYEKSYKLTAGSSVKIKDILNSNDVSIFNIKFDMDSKYLELKTVDGEYYLFAKKVLGETTLTASYEDISVKTTITITSDTIEEATFDKDVYYIYKGSSVTPDITTVPSGADLSLIEFTSSDDSIVSFDENNKMVGKSNGTTTVTLKANDKTDTATVYVVDNMITVRVKENGVYTSMDEYKYSSSLSSYTLSLAVKFEDTKKAGYTQNDLSFKVENSGTLKCDVSYDRPYSADSSAYLYNVTINYDSSVIAGSNQSVITFSLPDGSVKVFKIYK